MPRIILRYEFEANVIDEHFTRMWTDEIVASLEKLIDIGVDKKIFESVENLAQFQMQQDGEPRAKMSSLAELVEKAKADAAPVYYPMIDKPSLEAIRDIHKNIQTDAQSALLGDDEYTRGMANMADEILAILEQRPCIVKLPDGSYKQKGENDGKPGI